MPQERLHVATGESCVGVHGHFSPEQGDTGKMAPGIQCPHVREIGGIGTHPKLKVDTSVFLLSETIEPTEIAPFQPAKRRRAVKRKRIIWARRLQHKRKWNPLPHGTTKKTVWVQTVSALRGRKDGTDRLREWRAPFLGIVVQRFQQWRWVGLRVRQVNKLLEEMDVCLQVDGDISTDMSTRRQHERYVFFLEETTQSEEGLALDHETMNGRAWGIQHHRPEDGKEQPNFTPARRVHVVKVGWCAIACG